MANTKSAIKEIRLAERRRQRNKPVRSALKTHIRKAESLIVNKDLAAAGASAVKAEVALDKAAAKGVIHPNNAARRTSRLMRKLAAAQKAAAS